MTLHQQTFQAEDLEFEREKFQNLVMQWGFWPFMAKLEKKIEFVPKFWFQNEGSSWKKSYEGSVYESVDIWVYFLLFIENQRKTASWPYFKVKRI